MAAGSVDDPFALHRAQKTQIFRARVLQPSKRFFSPHEKTSDLEQV